MTLGGILEFFLGNTFSFVVFCSFGPFIPFSCITCKLTLLGGFWFTLGSTLTPSFNAFGTYNGDSYGGGLQSPGFHAAFGSLLVKSPHSTWLTRFFSFLIGFFLLFMGLLSLIYLVCALRTNVVFVAIFLGLFMTFVLLAASYWHHAIGHHDLGGKLQVVSYR